MECVHPWLLLAQTTATAYTICWGRRPLKLMRRGLPDHAVCAILPMLADGLLRVVYDPDKPDALEHVSEMLRLQGMDPSESPLDEEPV